MLAVHLPTQVLTAPLPPCQSSRHSKVYRAGVTAQYLNIETSECSFHANASDKALDLRFHLASKGGRTTSVLFQLGLDDLPVVLDAIASALPESVGALASAAAVANAKVLQQLAEARRVQGDDKARAAALIEQLETVSEFVTQKYCDAPAGSDEQEAAVKDKLDTALNALRQLKRLCGTPAQLL